MKVILVTTSERARSLLLGALIFAAGCAPSGGVSPAVVASASSVPVATTVPAVRPLVTPGVVASVTPAADENEEPRFQFEGTALERVDGRGRSLWKASLPAEGSRQMAVLGDTVLVWGSSNTLRRFDIATGRQIEDPIRVEQVLDFLVHGEVLVQSTASGLVGVGEKSNLWQRAGLKASSMVVGGPSEQPLVLLVASGDGKAHVIDLENGRDVKFPVPKGAFARVALERDSGVVTWLPRTGGRPVMTDGETGEVL